MKPIHRKAYYIDPGELDQARRDFRAEVIRRAMQEISVAADGNGAFRACVIACVLGDDAAELEISDMATSYAAGNWRILSETWECVGRYYTAKILYADAECVAIADAAGWCDPSEDEEHGVDVDVIWFSREEFRAMSEACGSLLAFSKETP